MQQNSTFPDLLSAVEWSEFIDAQGPAWDQFYTEWLHFPGPLYILRYEDLITDLRGSLIHLIKFLGFSMTSERLNCVLANSEGLYHRRNSSSDQREEYFTPAMENKMKVLQGRLEDMVTVLRTDPLGGLLREHVPNR